MLREPASYRPHSTTADEFPFGEGVDCLIVCLNREQRRNVIDAFKKPARYVLPGAAVVTGSGMYGEIIFFTPSFPDPQEGQQFADFCTGCLKKLKPGGLAFYV
jgi:hypothetical protein